MGESTARAITPPPGFILEEPVVEGGAAGVRPPPGFILEEFRRQVPPSNSMLENVPATLVEHAPAIGSALGGIAGGFTGGPAGAMAGTGLGASIGTSAKQIIDRLKGGTQQITGPEGIIHEQARNIVQQQTLEAGGQLAGKAISGVGRAVSPTPREGAERAQELLRPKGGSLSAAQATESPTLNLAESFARAGAGGKGQFIGLDARNAVALEGIKNDLISSISKAPVDDRVAGKIFQSAITKGEEAHGKASDALYKAFAQRSQGVMVDVTDLKRFADDLADQYSRIGGVGKSDAGGKLIDQLKKVPDQISFGDAHELRSNLLAQVRDLRATGTETKALATASQAARRIDAAMEASTKSLSPQLLQEYRNISKFYRHGKEAFNNDLITSLMREQPERVGEELFKIGNVSEIIQAKASLRQAMLHDKSVDAADAYRRLQAGYLNAKLTGRGATDKMGETTAQNLLKDLAESRTDRQFAVMFTPEQREAIHDFAKTAYLTLNNKPQNFGVLAPLMQASAIGVGLASMTGMQQNKEMTMAAVGVLFGPWGLAHVLTNPRAVSVLAKGLKLPAGIPASAPIITKLSAEFTDAMKSGYDASKQ